MKHLSLKELITVSRPFWWVSTSVPFIVGFWLGRPEIGATLVIGALYFAFAYNLLMYGVNDIFDYESDILNARKNGVAHGSVLAKTKHPALWFWIVLINLPFVLYLFAVTPPEMNVVLLLILFIAVAYSVPKLRFKEVPFLDSLTSAFHYSSPLLFGLVISGASNVWLPAFASFFLWAAGNHAFGAIQDISPDKKAGIRSIATELGAGRTIIFSLVVYTASIIVAVSAYGLAGLVSAAAIAPYFITIVQTWRVRRNNEAPEFKTAWHRFLYLNYIVGGVASILLIFLYNSR